MLPTVVTWALALILFTARARGHDWDVFDALPDCWLECLGDTSNGCDESTCVCEASQSNKYLPAAVECMVTTCESSEGVIDSTFINPLIGWCFSIDEMIPDSVASSAYDAAGATATATSEPESTSKHHESSESHKTHSKTSSAVKTATTTSEDDASTTDGPTSAATVRSSVAETSSAASTQAQQSQAGSTTTTSSQAAQGTLNEHGGSPFDITAGASYWSASTVLGAIGAAIGILIRI